VQDRSLGKGLLGVLSMLRGSCGLGSASVPWNDKVTTNKLQIIMSSIVKTLVPYCPALRLPCLHLCNKYPKGMDWPTIPENIIHNTVVQKFVQAWLPCCWKLINGSCFKTRERNPARWNKNDWDIRFLSYFAIETLWPLWVLIYIKSGKLELEVDEILASMNPTGIKQINPVRNKTSFRVIVTNCSATLSHSIWCMIHKDSF